MSHLNVPIKQGEIVTIIDGSYMVAICPEQNKLTHSPKIPGFHGNIPALNHKYVVIATNVPCPQERDILSSLHPFNNCIIKDLSNDVIWFCSGINLKTVRNLID